MKIDVFNHIMTADALDRIAAFCPPHFPKILAGIPTMLDVDARLRHIEPFEDYSQVLSASNPVIDDWAGPDDTPALARTINEGMAAICAAQPDRFPGWIATLPMNNPDEALKEIDRAVRDGGACGIQIYSNVGGKPLDLPEFQPVFARMAELDKPIWLHPIRPPTHADYAAEETSRFDIWWALGWAYETSAAMARIVFSGVFGRHPELKIVAHHWGAYIPHADGRMEPNWSDGVMIAGEADGPLWKGGRSLRDSFRLFYGDTAMFGGQAASQCGLAFFGAERSVFATDYPFDKEAGMLNLRGTIDVIDALDCSEDDRRQIYERGPLMLLGEG